MRCGVCNARTKIVMKPGWVALKVHKKAKFHFEWSISECPKCKFKIYVKDEPSYLRALNDVDTHAVDIVRNALKAMHSGWHANRIFGSITNRNPTRAQTILANLLLTRKIGPDDIFKNYIAFKVKK